MKITKIRIDGKKPTTEQLTRIVDQLRNETKAAHFITNVNIVNSSRIDLVLRREHFKIDVLELGYNTLVRFDGKKIRTNKPSHNQRKEYNNIVNKVLDDNNVAAVVRSGPVMVREYGYTYTNLDWDSNDDVYNLSASIKEYDYKAIIDKYKPLKKLL